MPTHFWRQVQKQIRSIPSNQTGGYDFLPNNPAPRPVSPAEARFSRDLSSVLCELGAAREVSFEIVDAAHSPGLCLAYSMQRWPEVEQASALFRVSRFVAGQNRGVQLHDLRLQNLSNGQVWDLSESGIAVHTSSAPSAQRCFEMDLTARLQAKAQGQLDQVLGGGAALALVDCESNGPRNLHPTTPIPNPVDPRLHPAGPPARTRVFRRQRGEQSDGHCEGSAGDRRAARRPGVRGASARP